MIRRTLYRTAKRTRKLLHRAGLPWRLATASLRLLPSALILGAQKGGTTSLHHILAQHPDIAASCPKEVYYFNREFHRGSTWYRTAFPYARTGRIGLEATPGYLLHPHAPGRARGIIPEAKLIAMLREPVARAYSGWRHMFQAGYDDLPFEEAVEREAERTDAGWERLLADPHGGV